MSAIFHFRAKLVVLVPLSFENSISPVNWWSKLHLVLPAIALAFQSLSWVYGMGSTILASVGYNWSLAESLSGLVGESIITNFTIHQLYSSCVGDHRR